MNLFYKLLTRRFYLFFLLACLLGSIPSWAQLPPKLWDRTLGGNGNDGLQQVWQTADGGYIVSGTSYSGFSGDKTRTRDGLWILKLDASGTKQWDQAYGAGIVNSGASVQQTADGGYVLAGTVWAGITDDKTEPSRGNYDYWILRLDANGTKLWDRTYGGDDYDLLKSIRQLPDGGYLVGGYSYSGQTGDKSQPLRGVTDYWIIRLDAQGNKLWDRTLGGQDREEFTSLDLTADGGCLVGGLSGSGASGDKREPSRGDFDYWVVKLSAAGTLQWERTLGGSRSDILTQVRQTLDGGYLVAGFSESSRSGEHTAPVIGGSDYWLIKLDAAGATQWDRTLGSSDQDELRALALTTDGGYLLGGDSRGGVSGDKTQPSLGFQDCWIVKVDKQGHRQWDRTYGGADADQLFSLQQTQDQGFILGSASASNHSADKSQDSKGGFDYWVIRLGSPPAAGLPAAHIAGDSVLCSQPIQLTATSNGLISSYRWNTGATTASISVGQPGTYTVVLTFAGGITATAQQVVTAFPTTLRIQGDTLLCPGSSGRLTANAVGALAYEWNTGEHAATIAITRPGTYTVTASYTGSCTSTRQIQVSALSLRIAGAAELCTGTPTTLTAQTVGARSFTWSTGETTPTVTVTQPGTYQVEVRFPNGCVLSASHTLTQPRATISGDSLLCPGHSGQLVAVAPGATAFRWSTGTTTPTVTITQPGLYTVLITYSSGCQRSLSQRVEMEPPIGAFSLGADTTICEGAALLLRAPLRPLAGLTYRWSTGATTPTLLVQQAGEYSVQLSTACETHTATRRLLLRPCLTIPNVITPNADLLNDSFVIQGLTGEWTLTLYSRWGQQVYTTAAYHNDWGATATAGTYYYILAQPSSSSSYKGWLEVIR